jgi:hypothetical protein
MKLARPQKSHLFEQSLDSFATAEKPGFSVTGS